MGEYAAQSVGVVSTKNQNNLECALAEAAYMTGMERNADVVRMASYAPLFANTEAWQWTPDLIWVNSLKIYETPNYYVQQLFSRNRGDEVLPTQTTGIETATNGAQNLYASATRDDKTGEVIVKAVNPEANAESTEIKLDGASKIEPEGEAITLAGDPDEVNSMDDPKRISPVESEFENAGANFTYTFPAHSMTVLRIKAQ
jgi:alpha-N-arabinofuranosidase